MIISQETKETLEDLGFSDVEDYFVCLAGEYDILYSDVLAVAELLGECELFDGLVTNCEDMAAGNYD